MKKIKNFNKFISEDLKIIGKINLDNQDRNRTVDGTQEIAKIEKPVEIRFDIEKSRHLFDPKRGARQYRHGYENEIKDEDIINIIDEAVEQITIDLMRGVLNIKEEFVIKSPDISIVCGLKSGEYNFDLIVKTVRRKRINIFKNQYVYDVSRKSAYRFRSENLNHQMPGNPLGVNSPGFGQGAHVGNWGADYGNPSQGVRGHFGNKGDKTSPHLPQKYKQPDFPTVVLDPTTGDYLTQDDVKGLLNDYTIKCRQNSEEPQSFGNIDSNTIEFIQNYLKQDE